MLTLTKEHAHKVFSPGTGFTSIKSLASITLRFLFIFGGGKLVASPFVVPELQERQ